MVNDILQFATAHGVKVIDVVTLARLAMYAKLAVERANEVNDDAYTKEAETSRQSFEDYAKGLGYDTEWVGVWPTLKGANTNFPAPKLSLQMRSFGGLPVGTTYQHAIDQPCYIKETLSLVHLADSPTTKGLEAPSPDRVVYAAINT